MTINSYDLGMIIGSILGDFIPIIIIYKITNYFTSMTRTNRESMVISLTATGIIMLILGILVAIGSGNFLYTIVWLVPFVISCVWLSNNIKDTIYDTKDEETIRLMEAFTSAVTRISEIQNYRIIDNKEALNNNNQQEMMNEAVDLYNLLLTVRTETKMQFIKNVMGMDIKGFNVNKLCEKLIIDSNLKIEEKQTPDIEFNKANFKDDKYDGEGSITFPNGGDYKSTLKKDNRQEVMNKKKITIIVFLILFVLTIFFVPANATTKSTKSTPIQIYQTTLIPIISIGVTNNMTEINGSNTKWAYEINWIVLASELVGLTILFGGIFYIVGMKKTNKV